ncbi:MAG TPA: hypothetical protein VF041_08390 [Gemmatimonadaceae bacterium]
MPTLARRVLLLATAAVVAATAACGGDSGTGPDTSAVAGTYDADTFVTVQNGVTTDQLANGSSVHLVLAPDGTATGRLFIPQGDAGGGDLDESLSGTWTLSGSTVTLSQPADTFLRDLPLRVRSGWLVGDAAFAGVSVHITLKRQ